MKNRIIEAPSKGEIIIYRAKDKKIQLEVKLEQETVWLSQEQIAKLFTTERSVITKHLGNIFRSNELDEKSNVQFLHIAFYLRQHVPFWNILRTDANSNSHHLRQLLQFLQQLIF